MISGKELRRTRRLGSCVSSEQLEQRMLLAVTAAEYNYIRSAYAAFNLPADMASINIIEIAPSGLSVANLKAAIHTAGTTNSDDLVVIRTTTTQNTITYTSAADEISIDIPAAKGALSIIGFTVQTRLTLDAAGMSRVLSIGSTGSSAVVNLGDMAITNGQAGGSGNGGGIYQAGGTLTLRNVQIAGNSAGGSGGGMYLEAGVTNLDAGYNAFDGYGQLKGNTAGLNGGGLYLQAATLTLQALDIFGNTAAGDGGGIYQEGGQCIWTGHTAASVWDRIDFNTAGGNGGGVYLSGGEFGIDGVDATSNTAAHNGGGLYVVGGQLAVANAWLTGNTAHQEGGALYQGGTATSQLANVLIGWNMAAYTGGMALDGGSATLCNLTITWNSMGGLTLLAGSLTLNNSVVALSQEGGWDIYQVFDSSSSDYPAFTGHNNLIGDGSHQVSLTDGVDGNMVGTATDPMDPMLDGGIYPLAGSPVINAGDNALVPGGLTTDLDGFRPRIIGGTVDLGAYERGLDVVINGTPGDDTITAEITDATLQITVNGTPTDYDAWTIETITVNGLAGNDTIDLSAIGFNDTISGGEGNDLIYGPNGNLTSLRGDGGDDTLYGQGGHDTIMGNTGNDLLLGGLGDDLLQGGLGSDTLSGGAGGDSLYGGDGTDLIEGDDDNDYIEGRGKADTIHGGAGNDSIYGGAGADLIYGDDGNDFIDVGRSSAFADSVHGGAGTDSVLADSSDILDADIESVVLA